MEDVMDRARQKAFAGVRLVQAAFHNRSLSLYTKLGFDAREPLSVMRGAPINKKMPGYDVRPALHSDLDSCNRVAATVHGHHRSGEVLDSLNQGSARWWWSARGQSLAMRQHSAMAGTR